MSLMNVCDELKILACNIQSQHVIFLKHFDDSEQSWPNKTEAWKFNYLFFSDLDIITHHTVGWNNEPIETFWNGW